MHQAVEVPSEPAHRPKVEQVDGGLIRPRDDAVVLDDGEGEAVLRDRDGGGERSEKK